MFSVIHRKETKVACMNANYFRNEFHFSEVCPNVNYIGSCKVTLPATKCSLHCD